MLMRPFFVVLLSELIEGALLREARPPRRANGLRLQGFVHPFMRPVERRLICFLNTVMRDAFGCSFIGYGSGA
jgi:hypothetical protein